MVSVDGGPLREVIRNKKSFALWLQCRYGLTVLGFFNGVARTLKKLRTSKRDYWVKQRFSSIAPLFKIGTSLKGKNLLPEAANSFFYEQFFRVCRIAFTTLGDLS